MDSMQLDPETVDNLDMYSHIPPILMEKCAALSVRPDTVKNLVQSMQGKDTGTYGVCGGDWGCLGWPWGQACCSLPGLGAGPGGQEGR